MEEEAGRTQYLLVTHQSPDFDAISAIFTWLFANGKKASDADISFGFVWPGKRWTKRDPNTIVVHFDTGNIYNQKTHDFDHHQDRDRWPSAARAVFESFPHLHEDALLREMIEFTDKVDSGSQLNDEDKADKDLRKALNDQLREINRGRPQHVLLICEQSGPRETIDLIANMEAEIGDIDDHDKMLTGLIALDRWYRDNKEPAKTTSIMPVIKDRHLFDKVCALFLQLMANDKWLYNLRSNEFEQMIDTLPEEPGKTKTQTVYDLYQRQLSNPIYRNVTELVQLVVFKGIVQEENEESKRLLQDLRERLVETNKTRKNKLIPIVLNRGPWGVVQLFPDSSFPERARIILALIMMKAWYNKRTLPYRIKPLIEEARWESRNGLTFVQTGETSISGKNIRAEVRRRYRDQIHVCTTLYVDRRTGVKSIGVLRVQKNLNGMDELANRLREIDPTADIFLFQPSKFVIYVKYDDIIDMTKPNREILLTPERIHQEAMSILHPISDDETADWDGAETTEVTEVLEE